MHLIKYYAGSAAAAALCCRFCRCTSMPVLHVAAVNCIWVLFSHELSEILKQITKALLMSLSVELRNVLKQLQGHDPFDYYFTSALKTGPFFSPQILTEILIFCSVFIHHFQSNITNVTKSPAFVDISLKLLEITMKNLQYIKILQ